MWGVLVLGVVLLILDDLTGLVTAVVVELELRLEVREHVLQLDLGPGKLDLEVLDFELVAIGALFVDFVLSVDVFGDVVFGV